MKDLPRNLRFDDPCDVVRASVLDQDQKRWLLVDWIVDERALLIADDEGMGGGRRARLGEVQSALHALEQRETTFTRGR